MQSKPRKLEKDVIRHDFLRFSALLTDTWAYRCCLEKKTTE